MHSLLNFRYYKLLVLIFIVVVSLFPRIIDISRPLDIDGADYARAAELGLRTNYFESDSRSIKSFILQGLKKYLGESDVHIWREDGLNNDVCALRHYHPAFSFYIFRLSQLLFGTTEIAMRVPPVIFGVLTCLLLFFISYKLCDENAFYVGLLASLLLAVNSAHISVSQYASFHSLFMLLSYLALFYLSLSLKSEQKPYFYLFCLFLALCFLTLEYAPLVLVTFLVVSLLQNNFWLSIENRRLIISIHIIFGLILVLALMTIIWPAGIMKLSILKGYIAYSAPIRSAKIAFKYGTWYTPYIDFFKADPILSVLIVLSLIGSGYLLLKTKLLKPFYPFLVYALLIVLINMRASATKLYYVSHILPAVCLVTGVLLAKMFNRGKYAFRMIPFVLIAFILVMNINQTRGEHEKVLPWKELSTYLQENSIRSQTILVLPHPYASVARFYNKENNFVSSYVKREESIKFLDTYHDYDYLVFVNKPGSVQLEAKNYDNFNLLFLKQFKKIDVSSNSISIYKKNKVSF